MADHRVIGSSPKKRFASTAVLCLLVFAATLCVYLATLPRSLLPGDSGELIVASRTLSIAHPPGFPLYLMLGNLFASVLAVGSIAWRYNLFSAVLGSATAGLVFLILTRVGVARILGILVAVALATLEWFWLQATTAEIYTLNALFVALLIYIALAGRRCGEAALPLLGFVGGLAMSHHISLVYGVVSALVILLSGTCRRPGAKTVILSVLLFAVGSSTWLYIPIRSSLRPPLVWTETDTLSGVVAHITGKAFRWRLTMFGLDRRMLDAARYFALLGKGSGVAMLALACLGVVANARNLRLIGGFVLLVALCGLHYVLYNIPDIDSHIFPALIGVAVLAGLGLQGMWSAARSARLGRGAALACACLVVLLSVAQIHPRKDQWFALDYARAIEASALDACGEECILVCSSDACFPLLYNAYEGDPRVRAVFVGLEAGPQSIDGWVEKAIGQVGISKVALFGAWPPRVAGWPTRAHGLVRVMGGDPGPRQSSVEFAVRGAGEDLRDYASRGLSGDYYLRIATWHWEAGNIAAVEQYVARALAAAYDDVSVHLDAASLYRDVGRIKEARELAVRAIDIDPDSFEAHGMLAGFALRAGDNDLAIAEYKKSLKGAPTPGPLYSNLGAAYLAKGDYAAARSNFNKSLELDSTVVSAYVGLGMVLEAGGNLQGALSYYDRARRVDPTSQAAIRAREALLSRMRR